MLSGAFSGSEPEYYPRADAMDQWLGGPQDIQNIFVSWNEQQDSLERLFDTQLPAIWQAGRIPMITWEPFVEAPDETSPNVDQRIADGEFESYLTRWRTRLRTWLAGADETIGTDDDRRLYLRFAHEANGDWYPWAPTQDSTPTAYVQMWKTVYNSLMRDQFTTRHITWIWAVNHVDVGGVSAEQIYPGESFVDWIGIDGFNWGASQEWSTWKTPTDIFTSMRNRVQSLGEHPICVPEYASTSETESGHSVQSKNQWIRKAFRYFAEEGIDMAIWFNINKETDWAVFDSERGDMVVTMGDKTYKAYSAYRNAIQSLN